jgi:hypothetical protein
MAVLADLGTLLVTMIMAPGYQAFYFIKISNMSLFPDLSLEILYLLVENLVSFKVADGFQEFCPM